MLEQCPDGCAVRLTSRDAYRAESDIVKQQSGRDADLRIAELQAEVDSMRQQLVDRDAHVAMIEELRQQLEKQSSSHVAEISVSRLSAVFEV